MNLSQFWVICYQFDVKLWLEDSQKPYVNYNKMKLFIFIKLLALKRVRSFVVVAVFSITHR